VKIIEGKTLYAFFAWHDLPRDATIGFRVYWNNELRFEDSFPADHREGFERVPVIRWAGGQSGGGTYDTSSVRIVLLVDGKEVAQGSVALDQ
jgi:hypothetical protein